MVGVGRRGAEDEPERNEERARQTYKKACVSITLHVCCKTFELNSGHYSLGGRRDSWYLSASERRGFCVPWHRVALEERGSNALFYVDMAGCCHEAVVQERSAGLGKRFVGRAELRTARTAVESSSPVAGRSVLPFWLQSVQVSWAKARHCGSVRLPALMQSLYSSRQTFLKFSLFTQSSMQQSSPSVQPPVGGIVVVV